MKIINFFLSILLLLIFFSCDHYDVRLKIKNNSDNDIYISISRDDLMANSEEITYTGPDKKNNFMREILPGETEIFKRPSFNAWDEFVTTSENKLLRVYIINRRIFNQHSWEKISEDNLNDSVLKFSLSDLEETDWLITIK